MTIQPYRHYQTYFAALLRQGMAEGSIQTIDAEAGARLIVAIAVGLVLQGLLDPQRTDWVEVARLSMEVILNGLARSEA